MTAGLAYETMNEQRRGYQNFTGSSASPDALGVVGPLRRDEDNRTEAFDQYVQVEWEPSSRWLLLGGVRHSTVNFKSGDKYLSNGDDSGTKRFSSTNPVLGATYKASDAVNLYASLGRGFETPTLNELSYRSSGTGMNFGLSPARSHHLEAGVKAFLGADMLLSAAVFQIKTQDEIAVLTNSGGRSVFQNVGGTKRDGVELALDARLPQGFGAYLAYSYIDARYKDSFLTCAGSPCTAPNTPVLSGNAIPGIPRSTLFADLTWKHPGAGFESGLEVRRSSRVYVNDVNDDAAPAYTVANLRLQFRQQRGPWRFSEFIRIDNLGDRQYAGSVIVNEGNRRYFEPAPSRSFLIGASASYSWQ
jgi:iron complex outermembrane recepter protein